MINKKYIKWLAVATLIMAAYFIVESFLSTVAQFTSIEGEGFKANYCSNKDSKNMATIVLVGGGQWGDYWAQEFAKAGFSGLSLKYTGGEDLPMFPEEINLEYFENAINWLRSQPEVDAEKIVVMGASRNAELSLVIAATLNNLISGVIAYAPSSVSWSNTFLPYNSDDLKPSWKYKGLDIPYIPMDKLEGNNSSNIQFLDYWKGGLAKTEYIDLAAIKVEEINGPILLFSGKDDQVWPSDSMANMIEKRLKTNDFKYPIHNIQYENAGHLISTNPEGNSDIRTGSMTIEGKNYEYEFGGTMEGDRAAKIDAKIKLMQFIKEL